MNHLVPLAITIVGTLLARFLIVAGRRAWKAWRAASRTVVDQCCECSAELTEAERHVIVSEGDFSDVGERMAGGWFMAATLCAEHCPGGCRQGCPVVVP